MFFIKVLLVFLLSVWNWNGVFSEVLELNSTTFNEQVSLSENDNWFIMFYAPWCHHCKAMAPVMQQLSSYLEDAAQKDKEYPLIHVAKIDATKSQSIAGKYGVNKLPRILYKKGNLTGIYDGPRSLEGFQLFLNRFADPVYQNIKANEDGEFTIPTIHPYHNVTFALEVFCDVDASALNNERECSEETKRIINAFQQTASSLHLHSSFALIQSSSSSSSSGVKKNKISKELKFCKFSSTLLAYGNDFSSSSQLSNTDELLCMDLSSFSSASATSSDNSVDEISEQLSSFVTSNNYPFLSIFDNHNFKILSHLNKTMIIAIIDEKKEITSKTILSSLKTNFLQMTQEIQSKETQEKYILGYLNGNVWKSFVRHHDAFIPSLLVIDHQDERHAVLKLISSGKTSENYSSQIKKFLTSLIIEENLEFQETIAPGLIRKMIHRFKKHFPYSLLLIALPSLLLIVSIFMFPYPNSQKSKKQ
jgi:thiol-disulfide isomerase/thioredoxin